MKQKLQSQLRSCKHPITGVLLLVLLFLQTLAASHALHLDVHQDAGASDHTCAVQLISSGQIDLPESSTWLPLPPFTFASRTVEPLSIILPAAGFHLPTRGPPSLA